MQRLPLTLLALELEEPFPYRPTSDALCRRTGTIAAAPTVALACDGAWAGLEASPLRCRLTAAARAVLALPGLGGALLTAQNVSNRTGAN